MGCDLRTDGLEQTVPPSPGHQSEGWAVVLQLSHKLGFPRTMHAESRGPVLYCA
jgi:hypothetical protein